MTYTPREVSVDRVAPQRFLLTIGDLTVELDAHEAWLLAHESADAVDKPTQMERLKVALATALDEVHDLLTDPRAVRAYDLTAEDEKALAWLSIRVASPWK
ncbi:hypothetical protein [Mycolicibacter arupensis]|uniref:Uncharacterized protein n=1 Tax=Mycolicibacter arupensis TaxID=342002 RepID=A0A5C7Y2C5_9MYCO|nr:hypothetical protein [Mycolicibacter arupensis]TXI55947.1 MAG: hypothetical protein E6Q54_12020 [Mycolicibacter arupensis]